MNKKINFMCKINKSDGLLKKKTNSFHRLINSVPVKGILNYIPSLETGKRFVLQNLSETMFQRQSCRCVRK